jgi:hypothetical protein
VRPHPPGESGFRSALVLCTQVHRLSSPKLDQKRTSLTHVHRFIGYRNPNLYSLPKSSRLTYLSVYDRSVPSPRYVLCVRDFNFLKFYLFVFHNTDTFPPPLLVFTLSVMINTQKHVHRLHRFIGGYSSYRNPT